MAEATMLSEKTAPVQDSREIQVNELQEALDGYVLDPSKYPDNAAGLKTTPDRQYVLIPQPSDSPRDPLNWSSQKKSYMLAIVSYIAALADYTGGTAIITIIPQAMCVSMSRLSGNATIDGLAVSGRNLK